MGWVGSGVDREAPSMQPACQQKWRRRCEEEEEEGLGVAYSQRWRLRRDID